MNLSCSLFKKRFWQRKRDVWFLLLVLVSAEVGAVPSSYFRITSSSLTVQRLYFAPVPFLNCTVTSPDCYQLSSRFPPFAKATRSFSPGLPLLPLCLFLSLIPPLFEPLIAVLPSNVSHFLSKLSYLLSDLEGKCLRAGIALLCCEVVSKVLHKLASVGNFVHTNYYY